MPPAVTHLVGKATRAKRMRVRPLDFARYEADLAIIMDIFNDAWSDNWGFVPMSQAELRHMRKALKPIVRPQPVAIAEPAGRPLAMALGTSHGNRAVDHLHGPLPPLRGAKH